MINDIGAWMAFVVITGIVYAIGRLEGRRRGFKEGWNLKKMYESVDLNKSLSEVDETKK